MYNLFKIKKIEQILLTECPKQFYNKIEFDKEKIEAEINKEIEEKGLCLFVFVITDIVNSNSTAIVLGNRTDAVSKTYEIKDNLAEMPGVVSRKKQVLPLVEKNM